ncbi:MAG: hypothetical protein PHY31_08325, partial [Smithellaceae bacterium]|nr:hypothetical protein [Smithellaceae bacterium]
MKRIDYGIFLLVLLVLALTIILPANSFAKTYDEWTGNLNLLLGTKGLDEDDWRPVDQQGEVGLECDFRHTSWPISIAVDLLGAVGRDDKVVSGNTVYVDSRTSEFSLGIKKIWDDHPSARPFVAGGLSFVRAEYKTQDDQTG